MTRHCPHCGAKMYRTTTPGGIPTIRCPNGPHGVGGGSR